MKLLSRGLLFVLIIIKHDKFTLLPAITAYLLDVVIGGGGGVRIINFTLTVNALLLPHDIFLNILKFLII